MSLWSQPIYNTDASFTPLFRLLDDFDRYSNIRTGSHHRNADQKFNAKFDVVETADAFELHAELSGIEKKDVQIEFTDHQTISVRGRIERNYRAGTPPTTASGAIEDTEKAPAAIDHHATVEDEVDDASTAQPTPATSAADTTAAVVPTDKTEASKKQDSKHHFWVSERSVGSFHRTFTFPSNIDQEGVKAALNNGVLTIVVPKAKKLQTRSIAIA
jgi:HSP20 family molecular chaperone IbpA